jgi:transcriptional regulator with XRE-family HTH domain
MESTAPEIGASGGEMLSLIGRRLRALRKSQNLSQREVADAIGLPQSNLSRIENGKQRLNLTVLSRMLGIYQTSIQDFFAREEEAVRSGESITQRERALVESYRRLSGDDKREVDGYVDWKLYRARRDRAPIEA